MNLKRNKKTGSKHSLRGVYMKVGKSVGMCGCVCIYMCAFSFKRILINTKTTLQIYITKKV